MDVAVLKGGLLTARQNEEEEKGGKPVTNKGVWVPVVVATALIIACSCAIGIFVLARGMPSRTTRTPS